MAANKKAARMLDTSGAAQENSQTDLSPFTYFSGNVTRRQNTVIQALQRQPMAREALDEATGASNSPSLVLTLRRRGLDLPCHRVDAVDKHGQICRPGIYSLSTADRIKLHFWRA